MRIASDETVLDSRGTVFDSWRGQEIWFSPSRPGWLWGLMFTRCPWASTGIKLLGREAFTTHPHIWGQVTKGWPCTFTPLAFMVCTGTVLRCSSSGRDAVQKSAVLTTRPQIWHFIQQPRRGRKLVTVTQVIAETSDRRGIMPCDDRTVGE